MTRGCTPSELPTSHARPCTRGRREPPGPLVEVRRSSSGQPGQPLPAHRPNVPPGRFPTPHTLQGYRCLYHLTWYTYFPRSEQKSREPKSRVYHVTFSTWYRHLPRSGRGYIPPVPLVPENRDWIHAQEGANEAGRPASAGAGRRSRTRPYVNDEKSLVHVVHRWETQVDQAKRRTTSLFPRGTPGARQTLVGQVSSHVRREFRRCTTSRGTRGASAARCAFLATTLRQPPASGCCAALRRRDQI